MEKFSTRLLNNNTKSAGEKALSLLTRLAGLAAILILALAAEGCLVSNSEFDKARLERDDYRRESQLVHQANDALKREISEIYESCDLISTQLTVLAAMNLHDRYTAGLARPRPVLPPPITTRSSTATTPSPTRRPAGQGVTTTRRPQGDAQNTGAGTGGTRRSQSGGQSGQGGRTGGGNSPAPRPAPNPGGGGGGGGGSIDWGF